MSRTAFTSDVAVYQGATASAENPALEIEASSTSDASASDLLLEISSPDTEASFASNDLTTEQSVTDKNTIQTNLCEHLGRWNPDRLSREPYEVRLVKIAPAGQDGMLWLVTHVCLIDSAPSFDTVSYAWGESTQYHEIRVDGYSYSLRSNLYQYLLEMRNISPRPLLWIDVINTTFAHRGGQMRQDLLPTMSIAFRNARRTYCCTAFPFVKTPLSGLRRLVEIWHNIWADKMPAADADELYWRNNITIALLRQCETELRSFDHSFWVALGKFLDDEYFSRAWTLAEIICSKQPILRYGAEEVDWNDFCTALKICTFFMITPISHSPSLSNILMAGMLQRKHYGAELPNLCSEDIVLTFHKCYINAYQTIDRIVIPFTIMPSAFSDSNTGHFETNRSYPRRMSQEAALRVNARYKNYLSLSLELSSDPAYPSWVPDWSKTCVRFILNHPKSMFSASSHKFPAGGVTDPKMPLDSLPLTGLVVDTVKRVASYLAPRRQCDHYNAGADNNYFFGEWFEHAKEWSFSYKDYYHGKNEVLMKYIDTIQASGCNLVWRPGRETSRTERIEAGRQFLDFLENELVEETYSVRLFYAACLPSHDRRFGITERGRFCLLPETAIRGDLIYIPHGNRVPVILRRTPASRYLRNIGECYIQGMMCGEAAELDNTMEIEAEIV